MLRTRETYRNNSPRRTTSHLLHPFRTGGCCGFRREAVHRVWILVEGWYAIHETLHEVLIPTFLEPFLYYTGKSF